MIEHADPVDQLVGAVVGEDFMTRRDEIVLEVKSELYKNSTVAFTDPRRKFVKPKLILHCSRNSKIFLLAAPKRKFLCGRRLNAPISRGGGEGDLSDFCLSEGREGRRNV